MGLSPTDIVLSSAVVAAVVSGIIGGGIQLIFRLLDQDQERYEVLYGPLRFHLLMMKLIIENREEVSNEIKTEINNVEMRINSMSAHISPLTQKWLSHRDIIRSLLEGNPGYIKKHDFALFAEFLDAYLKREIIQEGQNSLSTEERITKIMDVVKQLQDRLL
jgi:hypothetical protein